jgi:hypothetical protein
MNTTDNCKETFLSGVTDAYFYSTENTTFAVPFSVARQLQLTDCILPSPELHIATTGDDYVVADSITAKTTLDLGGNGMVYTYDISATVTIGIDNVREAFSNMDGKDYYVVLSRTNGTHKLCYTLPGTFIFKPATSTTQTDETVTVSVTLKALSDFIDISLKQ